uniref:Uncharacterized protein n=1 Tax=Glossina pallidipes TaxID=7398 RepID=A0A1A9Z4J1_GLOPL
MVLMEVVVIIVIVIAILAALTVLVKAVVVAKMIAALVKVAAVVVVELAVMVGSSSSSKFLLSHFIHAMVNLYDDKLDFLSVLNAVADYQSREEDPVLVILVGELLEFSKQLADGIPNAVVKTALRKRPEIFGRIEGR